MLHEVGIQFPCVMSAYPRIRVSMFSTAYPRIRVSTSQYSLKFTWGGVVLSTAYPRIQPFQRCSFKVAGYSAVKPLDSINHTQNMSLSYDPLLESKHCVKMHVVPVNFIVAFHESCHQSKLKSFYHNCRRMSTPSRTEVPKLKFSTRR